MTEGPRAGLTTFVTYGALDAELGALLWVLTEHGIPLVVAAADTQQARGLRAAIAELLPAGQRMGDGAIAGGTLVGDSFEDVLRTTGGQPTDELADEMRDLGVVVVLRDSRVWTAHYVRPVERDGAGHLQRRPPALLAASAVGGSGLDHFSWSISGELASRCGLERAQFEDLHQLRTSQLERPTVADAG